MSTKIHVSQIVTGILPGKIPVYDAQGQLKLIVDPVDNFDAVNKQYLDSRIEQLKTLIPSDTSIEHSLDIKKTIIKAQIDDISSNVYKFDGLYREQFEQALEYTVQDFPNTVEHFPLIQLDSTFYNITPKESAEKLIKQRKDWLIAITQLERLRLQAKQDIDNATSLDYINDILTKFINTTKLIWQI